ncbi:MAG: N-6 DNA methylase [Candidatus Hodarchaeota archaeon]
MAKRTKKKNEKKSNGISDLMKELWQAAVNMRGPIEPADYKRYVLPLIFLRFLSINFEKRWQELVTEVREPESPYYASDEEMAKQILNDPDEYRSVGAFMLPEIATWDYIRSHAQDDDIKVKLDDAMEALEKEYPEKLRGLLPRIYAGSNLDAENVRGLINLFSKDIFKEDHGGADLIGHVYEYFIGEFASSEGKRGGEYFTPVSIVRCLVNMLEPVEGVVIDPCCGSGGMFVQSDVFTKHNRKLSFVGQESKDFNYRLCKMNLFMHQLDGKIELGNSYHDDKLDTVKADYLIANPPFNDGSKGENGWGADRIAKKDPRLKLGDTYMPLAPRNANTMWILHFLYHIKDGGTAGFVMATGELSNSETARFEVRKSLVELNYVDCIVQLTGQLFANTQIPCALWFLSKNRNGKKGSRKREGEILFVDGRKLGSLIPGSRKQKQLSDEELEKIAAVYRQYKRKSKPDDVPGFCRVATIEEIREHNYALTPGRYVGAEELEEDDEPFEERFPRLVNRLEKQFEKAAAIQNEIRVNLKEILDAS